MIDIAKLTEDNVGDWVLYTASDGHVEKGKIKSWNDSGIFVVYNSAGNWSGDLWKDYTAAHTSSERLEFADKVDQ